MATRPTPTDLGPVPFSITLAHEPRADRSAPPPSEAGGPLAALQAAHAAAYRGRWTVQFGEVPLKLKTHVDLDAVEELFVFLIELVDGGFGEWTLMDKDEVLVIEGQVFGPDVDLEFGDGDGGPGKFRRVRFPERAKVRLRAVVEEGARLIRRLLVDASVADPAFGDLPVLGELRADLEALVQSVSELPLAFRSKDAE